MLKVGFPTFYSSMVQQKNKWLGWSPLSALSYHWIIPIKQTIFHSAYFSFLLECGSQVEFASALLNKQVHTDAFFRSQRDINRHRWLHFWKIQINSENFIFLPFWGRLGEIFQKWPYFLVFERIFFWNFDLKIIFFKQKQDFVIFI